MISSLDRELKREDFGGKAAALSRLARAGFPVPAAVCLSPDALVDPARRGEAREAAAALGADLYAVRSSAIDEDGDSSFAGVHLSLLGVAAPGIAAALERVLSSAHSEAAAAYRRKRGLAAPRMGALVQTLIRADVSGVAFTRHPVTGEKVIVVEAAHGLGEVLVSGRVIPEHLEVSDSGEVVSHEPGELDLRLCIGGEGVVEEATEVGRRGETGIRERGLADVVALARRCEQIMGQPQDIEWALADERLWLLQSRPITTSAMGGPAVG